MAAGHAYVQRVTDDVVREAQAEEASASARRPNRQQGKKPAEKVGAAAKGQPRPKRKG